MTKNVLLLAVLLCATNLYAQISSNCNAPAILLSEYSSDVKDLALKRLYQLQSPDTNSIIIPQSYQDTIWQGLAAIFNVLSIPERNSVFDIYCIHQYESNSMLTGSIRVTVDTSYTWTQQWQNLQTTTGYAELDSLLVNYGFLIQYYSSTSNIAYLNTAQEINTYALCDSIETFDGVIFATSVAGGIGGGDWIYYNSNDSIRQYYFTLAYGDCPSGCLAYYTWKFNVYSDCSVEFMGIDDSNPWNESFPYPINCNIISCGVSSSFVPSSTNICTGDTIYFINTSIGTTLYEWQENGVSFSTATDTSRIFDTAGTFTISLLADSGNCMDAASVVITVNPSPIIDLGPDTTICSGCSILLNGGSGFPNYTWSDGSTAQFLVVDSAGTYSVQIIYANGCSNSDSIVVDMMSDINELHNIGNVRIHPNPNSGEFIIEIKITKPQDLEIKLINAIGQLIYKENLNQYSGTYQKTIDVGKKATGIYTLQLITEKVTINNKIIIIIE